MGSKSKNPPKSKRQQTLKEKIERYGGKTVNRKEGGSMGSKSKSSKPKGVGCATSGYGKAMGGR